MKWPYRRRIDPAHAWGVVAVGTAGLVGVPAILATLHAADSHFRWWWPTGWMVVPAAIFVIGAGLVAVPVRRHVEALPAGPGAGGAAEVAEGGGEEGAGRRAPDSLRAPVPESQPGRVAVRPRPAAGEPVGHVFLSAAAEDAGQADRLQQDLEAAGIVVWRDATDLEPGDDQPLEVRRAITEGALVFLACFSSRSTSLAKSYSNVALLLAVDQLRLRRPGVPWLIPVRFDDCPVPDIDLGGGRTLASLTAADLFGERRDAEAARLLAAVRRMLRQS